MVQSIVYVDLFRICRSSPLMRMAMQACVFVRLQNPPSPRSRSVAEQLQQEGGHQQTPRREKSVNDKKKWGWGLSQGAHNGVGVETRPQMKEKSSDKSIPKINNRGKKCALSRSSLEIKIYILRRITSYSYYDIKFNIFGFCMYD